MYAQLGALFITANLREIGSSTKYTFEQIIDSIRFDFVTILMIENIYFMIGSDFDVFRSQAKWARSVEA